MKSMLKQLSISLRLNQIGYFLGIIVGVMNCQPALAHAGVDHSKSCFLTVGVTRLQISGYQFLPELEGKHLCHFFPELGQIVLVVEPVEQGMEKTSVTLELAALSVSLNPDQVFTVLKQQPAQLMGEGLVSITQTFQQRGIYKLNVSVQKASGEQSQQSFLFLVGIPVTKILVMMAGVLFFTLVFAALKKPNSKT